MILQIMVYSPILRQTVTANLIRNTITSRFFSEKRIHTVEFLKQYPGNGTKVYPEL